MFGWNALAIMLKDTNNFTKGCDQGSKGTEPLYNLHFPACVHDAAFLMYLPGITGMKSGTAAAAAAAAAAAGTCGALQKMEILGPFSHAQSWSTWQAAEEGRLAQSELGWSVLFNNP